MPQMWQNYMARFSEIKNIEPCGENYGICQYVDAAVFTDETPFVEFVGARVSSFEEIPEGMIARYMPEQKYAVFKHKGAVDALGKTYDYIYATWLPRSGEEVAKTDDMEMYGPEFNPQDPEKSVVYIYVPLK